MVPIADRTTKVSLVAQVSGYIAGMDQAAKKTREVGSAAEQLANKKQAFSELGRSALAMGAVAAAAVGLAVAKFAEFDQAMSNVQAATQETASNMAVLREAALVAGAKTVYSASEAANAIEELGKNGLTTAQILSGGLDGALSLASSGQLEVARAAEVASLSMKQFKLDSDQIPHVADLLSAGAGKAAGDVEDLAQALAQGGLVAHSTGLTIEETTGVLAAFADNALIGSDAGTSLKTMLQRLTPQSKQAKEEMDDLGISAYDAQGNFIGAAAFAGNLRDSLKDLTPEQRNASEAIIFGSDAVRAANVLYDEGADGIQKYIDQTNDSGYAAKVAADRLNNLAGDVEQLGGSLDTALIRTGSGANGVLRDLVQTATFLVNVVGDLPQPALDAGLAIGTVAAAVLLTGGAALLAVPKIAAMKIAMKELGVTAKGTASAVGLVSGAVVAISLAVSAYVEHQAKIATATADFTDSLDKSTGAMTNYTRELTAKKLAESGAFKVATEVGVSQKELTDAVLKGGDAYDKVMGKFSGANNVGTFFTGLGIRAGNAAGGIRELRQGLIDSQANFKDTADATAGLGNTSEAATAKQEALTAATEEVTKAQEEWIKMVSDSDASFIDLTGNIDDLIKKNEEATGSHSLNVDEYLDDLQRQVEAQANWETNMVLLSARVSQGTLDELSRMGPEGAPLVAQLVDASDEELARLEPLFAEKAAQATGAFSNTLLSSAPVIQAASAQLGQGAADEIAGKLAAGTSTVQQIISEYGLIVEGTRPVVQILTDGALAKIQRVKDALAGINGAIAQATAYGNMAANGSDPLYRRASGGVLPGAPSSRDNMLIHAASGEFVVNAYQTSQNRALLEAINSGRGRVRGYASGGTVGQPAAGGAGGASGPRVHIENFTVENPKQLTAQGSTVAGLRRMDMELGL